MNVGLRLWPWASVSLLLTCLVTAAAAAPLPQEVYVWQRAWTEPVRAAVREHGGNFVSVVVLSAEVDWQNSQPTVVRVPLDYDLLTRLRRANHLAVGLALRVGFYSGKFAPDDGTARFLASLAVSLVNQAVTNGLTPAELQLDFDAAEGKLAGYRLWVETIRQKIAPVPLRITVLPVWLKHPEFRPLVEAAGGFILQVHSLQRPRDLAAPFTICDPGAAREAVRQADSFGVPFRVALPTYGYLVAFTPAGKFLGLSAEGPAKNWPVDAELREVRSDPQAMAALVQTWAADRPANLTGIIWYRFPVADDILNWRWPTLSAMLASRMPRAAVSVLARHVEPGLVEIRLVNDGDLDVVSRFALMVNWSNARLVAGDGLENFELTRIAANTVRLQASKPGLRLVPGDNRLAGWLRFGGETEVHVERENF